MSETVTDPLADKPLLVTASDVSKLLGISQRTLWRMVASGRFLQPIRYNRKLVRWKRDAVIQWVRDS